METRKLHRLAKKAVENALDRGPMPISVFGHRRLEFEDHALVTVEGIPGTFLVQISSIRRAVTYRNAPLTHREISTFAIDVTSLFLPTRNKLLDRAEVLLPLRHREALIGDLREDIAAKRESGWSEKQLARYVRWQVFCIIAECLKPWTWGGALLWIIHKLSN